ncbi:Phage-related holin (Lysis protein) [Anaerotruncus sp. 2789STDY5834896]|uniref:Phage-related holin (Lysis protein) n=1 Tax=uncultured Anaerotruncus sp. TaxID=905011 RepID=A0A1C6I6Q3_9FIRM|nr:Phage-related holin (Lysis protein) [uncultured Anaerotruncus sp.]
MVETINKIKVAITAGIAGLTAVWGWFGWLAVLWIAVMLVDYITGTMVAVKNGAWRSAAARAGLWHKSGMIVAVVAAGGADLVIALIIGNIPSIHLPFEYPALLCTVVMVWYIITELGSIVENAGDLGAPVPKFLRRCLASLADTVDKTAPMGDADENKTE